MRRTFADLSRTTVWVWVAVFLLGPCFSYGSSKLEDFRVKVQGVGTGIKTSFTRAKELVELRDKIIETRSDTDRVNLLKTYLSKRLESVKQTRQTLQDLEAAITELSAEDFPDSTNQAAVVKTYFQDCESLLQDLDLIELQAREIKSEKDSDENMYVAAVHEVRKSMADAVHQMGQMTDLAGQGPKKDELLQFLKIVRVGLATRQQLQLFDYTATAAAHKMLYLQDQYRKLHEEVFTGLSATQYMEDLAYSMDEIGAWTAILTRLLEVPPVPITESAEWERAIKRLQQRPKPFIANGIKYRYDRQQQRYWCLVPGRAARAWAPFDDVTNTGRYVRFDEETKKWFSHHPVYAGKPRAL